MSVQEKDFSRQNRIIASISYEEMRDLWTATDKAFDVCKNITDDESPEYHDALMVACRLDAVREKIAVLREEVTGEFLSYGDNGEVWVKRGSLKAEAIKVL